MRKIPVLVTLLGFLVLYALSYFAPNFNPADYWFFGLLALGFPYIYLAGIGLLLLLFLGSSKLRWLLLLALVPGFFKLNLFYRFDNGSQFKSGDEHLKVLSYNVRSFNRYYWIKDKNVFPEIVRLIKNENPDVLMLQEFYANNKATRDSLATLISQTCELPYYRGFSPTGHGKMHGLYTFSKYPILNSQETLFKQGSVNGFLETEIAHPNSNIRVLNFHLASYKLNHKSQNQDNAAYKSAFYKLKNGLQKRGVQVARLEHRLNEKLEIPTICGGDMNDTPHSYAYDAITSYLTDSYSEAGSGESKTYVGKLPGFRIDYIFHNQAFTAQAYRSIKEVHSDHYPIVSTLSFN